MSSLVESQKSSENLISNGLTIVNSFVDKPYHFPHTMTLFQPSRDRYDDPNLQKDEKGLTPFITWYKNHNRKTVVSLVQDYGDNISKLNCIGAGSYEIELATYSPTGIVVEPSDETMPIPLNMDKFREIRADEDEKNKYHFVVSRAVMPLSDLAKIVRKNIAKEQLNSLPNGILCLKGGDLQGELQPFRHIADRMELAQWFEEDWFKEKYVVYLPL